MKQLTLTTAIDADQNEAETIITVHHHATDMSTLAEDVGNHVIESLKQNPVGCIYFNPAVTVSCPSPLPEFFHVIRKERGRWCRQASKTFSQRVRRRNSNWVGGGEWITDKYRRYLDRALCFTGILFINGALVPSHAWPRPN